MVYYKQYGDIAIIFDDATSILVAEYTKREMWEAYYIPARSRIRGINVAPAGIPHFEAKVLEGLCQIIEDYLNDDTARPN